MAVQTREYLATRFAAGLTPTAQDFADLLDSFVLIDAWIIGTDGEVVTHDGDIVTL